MAGVMRKKHVSPSDVEMMSFHVMSLFLLKSSLSLAYVLRGDVMTSNN